MATKMLSFRVPDDIASKLDELAKASGLTRSDQLVQIISSQLRDPDALRFNVVRDLFFVQQMAVIDALYRADREVDRFIASWKSFKEEHQQKLAEHYQQQFSRTESDPPQPFAFHALDLICTTSKKFLDDFAKFGSTECTASSTSTTSQTSAPSGKKRGRKSSPAPSAGASGAKTSRRSQPTTNTTEP
jgi:hypothetical protein